MAQESFSFSRASINKIVPPEEGRLYFRDSDQRGLVLDVQASGVMSFQIYRKVAGKPVRISFGRFDASIPESREIPSGVEPLTLLGNIPSLNVRMARKLATAINAELDRGINPVKAIKTKRRAVEDELTLQGAFNKYYDDWLVPHGKRSHDDLRAMFNRNLGEVPPGQTKLRGRERTKSPFGVNWTRRKLSEIHQADVMRLHIDLQKGHGIHIANRVFELLRAIFNKIIEWKLFAGPNPCAGITKFEEPERLRFVKGEELPRFFDALAVEGNATFKDFVLLLLLTGARRENVLSIKWKDIDFDAALWSIPDKLSKNKKAMTIPLTSVAIEILELRRGNGSEFVFPAESKTGYMSAPKKHWVQLLKRAELDDLRLHDLRRSLGSWQAMTGASLVIIGQSLGHKSAEATRVYAQLQVDPVRESMERATQTMWGKAGFNLGANVVKLNESV
jgi:integrase